MIRRIVLLLAITLSVPAMGAVSKGGLSNPYIAQAADPQGMGTQALITQWVLDCAKMDHQTIVAQPHLEGLVPLSFANGLAYLYRTTGKIGTNSDVIDTLREFVASDARSDAQRVVAVMGLMYINNEAQSIDLSLDFLLSRPQRQTAIINTLDFIKAQCILTQAQKLRMASTRTTPRQ